MGIGRKGHAWVVVVVAQAFFGCQRGAPPIPVFDSSREKSPPFPVLVRKPTGPKGVFAGVTDHQGNPVMVACSTCHATKPANRESRLGVPLAAFHQNLVGKHGNLTCISCHNTSDGFSSLRLADGTTIPHAEVMSLCAQCHGTQARDYAHGAHGGMTGFWDRSKGSRVRNNCIDCHDPHAPKYPVVSPARGPVDRFQTRGKHE